MTNETRQVGRPSKDKDELQFTFVDERVDYLLPLFETLSLEKPRLRRDGNKNLKGYNTLAAQEALLLQKVYVDDENNPVFSTIVKRVVPTLKAALKKAARTELKDENQYYPVMSVIKGFGDSLSLILRPYTMEVNAVSNQKRKERTAVENRIDIDLTQYLKYANDLLTKIKSGDDDKVEWKDVSCALALVTGRRMAEIHLSAEFKKVSEYEVSFKGHLKGKERKDEVGDEKIKVRYVDFLIPTLVKADLVICGLNWLGSPEHGKRFAKSEETHRVNDKYSKLLSARVKEKWLIFDAEKVGSDYAMTYHKFRACYFLACFENVKRSDVEAVDYDSYSQKILIDNDATTISVYKKFKIKAGSITQI